MRVNILPAVILSAIFLVQPAAAQQASSSLEAKLALESSLEKKLKLVLSEALGSEDIIVMITAEMLEEKKKGALDILPGIPERSRPGETSISRSLSMVKKISATIILDKNMPEEDVQLARKLAAGLLQVPAEREDLISIERMSYRRAQPFDPMELFRPPNLWYMLWTVLITLFAWLTVSTFFSPISGTARNVVNMVSAKMSELAQGGGAREAVLEARSRQDEESAAAAKAGAAHAAAREDGKRTPFWFINESVVQNLAFILKDRPAQDLTIVLSYSPREVSARLVELLYPASLEAVAQLPRVTLMTEETVRRVEAEIASALDYVVGGEQKTVDLLETLPDTMQDKAVSAMMVTDPVFSRKVSGTLVKFSALKLLDQTQALALSRRVPPRTMAAALKGSDVMQAYLSKLSGGFLERIKEEIDLTRNISPEMQREERIKVTRALKQLVKEGVITLGRTAPRPGGPPVAGARPAPGAKPAASPSAAPRPGASPAPAAAPKPAPAPKP